MKYIAIVFMFLIGCSTLFQGLAYKYTSDDGTVWSCYQNKKDVELLDCSMTDKKGNFIKKSFKASDFTLRP